MKWLLLLTLLCAGCAGTKSTLEIQVDERINIEQVPRIRACYRLELQR